MSVQSRRCALTGCDELIEEVPDRPPRRYCSAAHRSAARNARRAEVRATQDARLAATLPWLAEPAERARKAAPASPVPASQPAGPLVPRGARIQRARTTSPTRAGTPPRFGGGRWRRPGSRRRSMVAALSVAGIVACGFVVTASQPAVEKPVLAPQPMTEEEWYARAQVALTSVNRQLDALAGTERTWQSIAQGEWTLPAAVRDLHRRRAVLEQRKATLQSQIDAYRSRVRLREELAAAQAQLRAIDDAMRQLPPTRARTPEQQATVTALNEQRDFRLRQFEARQGLLSSIDQGIAAATQTPLPDDGQRTAAVNDQVRALIEGHGVPSGDHGAPGHRPTHPAEDAGDVRVGLPPVLPAPGGSGNGPDVRADGGPPLVNPLGGLAGVQVVPVGNAGAKQTVGGAGGLLDDVTDLLDGLTDGGNKHGPAKPASAKNQKTQKEPDTPKAKPTGKKGKAEKAKKDGKSERSDQPEVTLPIVAPQMVRQTVGVLVPASPGPEQQASILSGATDPRPESTPQPPPPPQSGPQDQPADPDRPDGVQQPAVAARPENEATVGIGSSDERAATTSGEPDQTAELDTTVDTDTTEESEETQDVDQPDDTGATADAEPNPEPETTQDDESDAGDDEDTEAAGDEASDDETDENADDASGADDVSESAEA